LQRVEDDFRRGQQDAAKLQGVGKEVITRQPSVRLDYFEIVDPDTLDPIDTVSRPTLVAVAAYVGSTRLIDNITLIP